MQLREPAFHGVQPLSTGRREVKFETRVLLQPLIDGRRLVRRAVVQNHMQVKLCGRRAVDLLQEGQKLFGPVALGYPAGSDKPDDIDDLISKMRIVAELARLATSRQAVQALKTRLQIALSPFEHHRR